MFEELQNSDNVIKISASNPFDKECEASRIVIRRVNFKNNTAFQAERFVGAQVFHTNIQPDVLFDWVAANVRKTYRQVLIVTDEREITYLISSKGAVKRLVRNIAHPKNIVAQANNRRKKYLIEEGDEIPVFEELGIFTKEHKVVNSMYDKFKQINRFVEILNDAFCNYDGNDITLLDFGCGKSYLTFVIYYYFQKIRKINATIIGYDLKADVVAKCNALAQKYGYGNLQFIVADVTKDKLYDKDIDAVVSLHACDTATDYALYYAVNHNAKYIFSVPCCQHEINRDIHFGGDLDVLLKYGIIKERVAALLTDSVRALILEDLGYKTDVLEFVDLAHSPKNLMIRSVKKHAASYKNAAAIKNLMERYGFEQTLYNLIYKK